ncbi:MAG TPA: maleylpyruvate isomerase family mycothiol-dependent enzyme, partial [Microthrixaceae bacterium]|nr:maleylpyruvate isomerase family mycothiol-dependent enzyme [Microthrixaceae bacterium]
MTPPMTPPETQGFDRDALVGELRAVWRSLAEACDGIAEADWDIATRCPGWTVRDQLSHVLGTELMLAGAPAPGVDDVGEHVRNDIGRVNEAWIAQRRTRPGPDVLAEFREITSGRLDVLAAMTQANFDADSWT